MANPDQATLDRLAADAAAGRLRVPVTRSYPLNDMPQALADFAADTIAEHFWDLYTKRVGVEHPYTAQ